MHLCVICVSCAFPSGFLSLLVMSLFCLISLYYIPWTPVHFLTGDRKSVDPDRRGKGEELEENREGETIITIYCIEKNLFSIKEKIKRLEAKNLRDRSNVDS